MSDILGNIIQGNINTTQKGITLYDHRTMISGTTDISRRLMITTPITINTTIDNLIEVTYTWGTANINNILIATNATIKILN